MPNSQGVKYLSFIGDPLSARSAAQESICNWSQWSMEMTTLSTSIGGGAGEGTSGKFYYISSQCTNEIIKTNPAQPCVFNRGCTAQEFQLGCPYCNSQGQHPVSPDCCSSISQSIDCPNYVLGPRNSALPYTVLKNVCGTVPISQGNILTANDVTKFLSTTDVSFGPSATGTGKCFIIAWISDSPICKTSSASLQFYFNFGPRLLSTSGTQKVYSNIINSKLARRTISGATSVAASPGYTSIGDSSTLTGGFSSTSLISINTECIQSGTSRCNPQRADVHRAYYIRFGCDYGNLSIFMSSAAPDFPTSNGCQPCKDKIL